MKIENFIEAKYRELGERINTDYIDLYKNFSIYRLKEIFSTIHNMFVVNYEAMNTRLPTTESAAYYWADNSRELLLAIDILINLERVLNQTEDAFVIDEYYQKVIELSSSFLMQYHGSEIPIGIEKIEIYYTIPIVRKKDVVTLVPNGEETINANLTFIGSGSYAKVYYYYDTFYNCKYALKKANADLSPKEIARFKQEYEEMNKLNSPYVLQVYRYINSKHEYIMEYMDDCLAIEYEYITSAAPN